MVLVLCCKGAAAWSSIVDQKVLQLHVFQFGNPAGHAPIAAAVVSLSPRAFCNKFAYWSFCTLACKLGWQRSTTNVAIIGAIAHHLSHCHLHRHHWLNDGNHRRMNSTNWKVSWRSAWEGILNCKGILSCQAPIARRKAPTQPWSSACTIAALGN